MIYSFTPVVLSGTAPEINLAPVVKIVWNLPSNITYAGSIENDPVLYFENISKQDTVKLYCRWVNKQIDGEDIDTYFRDKDSNGNLIHKRYGTLKLKDKTYKAVIDLPVTIIPVSQGRAYTATITFTIVENGS